MKVSLTLLSALRPPNTVRADNIGQKYFASFPSSCPGIPGAHAGRGRFSELVLKEIKKLAVALPHDLIP